MTFALAVVDHLSLSVSVFMHSMGRALLLPILSSTVDGHDLFFGCDRLWVAAG